MMIQATAIHLMMRSPWIGAIASMVMIAGCSTTATDQQHKEPGTEPGAAIDPAERVAGDGPSLHRSPEELALVPDAQPREEPRSRYGNPESYEVFGKSYQVMDSAKDFVQRGHASWYGRQFHGKRTSSGVPYNMYAMTAAHREIPIPSWAEVTNLNNGRTIVVKVNDRGPFVDTERRIIDLSYAAAVRLGMAKQGTAPVELRVIKSPSAESPTRTDEERHTPPPAADHSYGLQTVAGPIGATNPPLGVLPTLDSAIIISVPEQPLPAARQQQSTAAAGASGYVIQAGAFNSRENAARVQQSSARIGSGVGVEAYIEEATHEQETIYRVKLGPIYNRDKLEWIRRELAEIGLESIPLLPDR